MCLKVVTSMSYKNTRCCSIRPEFSVDNAQKLWGIVDFVDKTSLGNPIVALVHNTE